MNQSIMLKEILEQPELLQACYDYNREIIPDIARAIKSFQPEHIVLVGRGTSYHSAVYLKYLFELYYHVPTEIAAPSVFTIYDETIDFSNTLVIAISQSGKGKDILKVVEKANLGGALTIAITNELTSPLAKEAKLILYNNVKEAVSYAATKTYTSTLYLIVKLVYELTHEKTLFLEEEKLMEALKRGFAHYEEIKKLVHDYKNIDELFVLSRGTNLTLAYEMALKIKETSRFHVSSYPISEFYHGPIVMVHKNTPVILLGVDPVMTRDMAPMIKELNKVGAFVLGISNDSIAIEDATKKIFIQSETPIYALFETVMVLQLFASELSVLRGNNPDFIGTLEHIETI